MDPICVYCHQPILPTYYFCPNCGMKIGAGLSTSIEEQIKLYLFSIILPFIGFLFVTKWEGNKYFKSQDEKMRQIGMIAWILILLSTGVMIWSLVAGTKALNASIQSQINAVNTDGY